MGKRNEQAFSHKRGENEWSHKFNPVNNQENAN